MKMFYSRSPKEVIEYRLNVKPYSDVYLKKFNLIKKHVLLVTKVNKSESLDIRQEILDDIKENSL